MAVIQVPMEISADAFAGLLDGTLKRHGGVIYKSTGGVFEHLKDTVINKISEEVIEQGSETFVSNITKHLKNPKIIVAIGLGAVMVGGVTYYFTKKNKKDKENITVDVPECVMDYNASLCAYLETISNGTLKLDTIDCVIENIENIKECYSNNEIDINFTEEKSKTLLNFVYDYTNKLAEANSFETNKVEKPVFISGEDTLDCLRVNLEIQKQIFEKAV